LIELEFKALMLENKAKNTKNSCERVHLFNEALKIREKLGHRTSAVFCLANLRFSQASCLVQKCVSGREELSEQTIKRIGKFCFEALSLFLELGIFEFAVNSLALYMKAYSLMCKQRGRYEYSQDYISLIESGIKKIKELKTEDELLRIKGYAKLMYNYHNQKSIYLSRLGAIDALRESCHHLEKAIEYAKLISPSKVKTLQAYLLRRKIKILKSENASPEQIAKLYLEAAQLSRELGNKKVELEDYADYHKYMAYHFLEKGDLPTFWYHIEKSIKFNELAENSKGYHFVKAIYLREKALRSSTINERLKLLQLAKEEFFKADAKKSGYYLEFRLALEYAKRAQKEGDLEEVINNLRNATKKAEKIGVNKAPLVCEINRTRAMMAISKGDYSRAYSLWKEYMDSLAKIARETAFFERMKHIGSILGFLSKKYFQRGDLMEISKNLLDVATKRQGLFLFDAYSLLQSYATMIFHGIEDVHILSALRNKISSILIGHEKQQIVERDLAQLKTLSEYEWFLKFPLFIIQEYENFEWFAYDCPSDMKHLACSMFYARVLEPLLRIIVEFNAKVVWRDKWKDELNKVVADRDFERYLLSDLVNIIKKLKSIPLCHCSYLDKEIIDLLEKHVHIRNSLAHGETVEVNFNEFKEEIKRILHGLRVCTPTILQIREKRAYGYRTSIIWGHFPRHVQLITKHDLKENSYYYSTPFVVMEGTRVIRDPPILISAYEVYRRNVEHLPETGTKTVEYCESFHILEKKIHRIVLVKELAQEIWSKLEDIDVKKIELGQLETLVEKPEMRQRLKEIVNDPRKLRYFLFEIYHLSFEEAAEAGRKDFEFQSQCFEKCLKILEAYYGPMAKSKMIKDHSKTVVAMFRNMIIGKGVGSLIRIDSKEDLLRMLEDFDKRYRKYGIRAPSVDEIIKELKNYENKVKSEKISKIVQKFYEDSG